MYEVVGVVVDSSDHVGGGLTDDAGGSSDEFCCPLGAGPFCC